MNTLYLFIDESGNFDFSKNGSKYFTLTVLSTTGPYKIGSSLLALRYKILPNYGCAGKMEENGYFHATEDLQSIRDQVFNILKELKGNIRIDSVIAQKNKANPALYDQVNFYKKISETAFKYALNRASSEEYEHVVLVLSSIFSRKQRGILKQIFKSLIKRYEIPFSLYFHDSQCDPCNQAVDYC